MPNSHKAIIVASTTIDESGIREALEYIGAPGWGRRPDENITDHELLSEFMGRLCYKSFVPGLNPNVTKVREGNQLYLENVLSQKHGSVFEHASVSFALLNVSRILTHELVRHRVGIGYSQESQRFVRLDDFKLYIPDLTEALMELTPENPQLWLNPHGGDKLELTDVPGDVWVQHNQDRFIEMANNISKAVQSELADYIDDIGLDNGNVKFHVKKQITSALRRLIPGGVNTNIGVTANHRTWRHLIQQRTSSGAETEIVEVFGDIAKQLHTRYPNIYQDMIFDQTGKHIHFVHEKI